MEELKALINEYSWLLVTGVALLLFNNTITELVDGIMIFLGNDYHEDDVVEVDGSPGRIVRVGMWKTVFFIYHVVDGKIVCFLIYLPLPVILYDSKLLTYKRADQYKWI